MMHSFWLECCCSKGKRTAALDYDGPRAGSSVLCVGRPHCILDCYIERAEQRWCVGVEASWNIPGGMEEVEEGRPSGEWDVHYNRTLLMLLRPASRPDSPACNELYRSMGRIWAYCQCCIILDYINSIGLALISLFTSPRKTMSVHDPEPTRSYTAGAEGYTEAIEPTISRLPSIQNPPDHEVFWKPEDPDNPRLWPLWYKGLSVVTISLGATVVSLFSTVYTSGIPGLQEEFHISKIVGLLGVFTYLLGMATGTLVSAPLSEVFGRRPVYLVSMGIFLLLVLPSALARNIEAILISRFFGGLFGSTIMGNSPASVNDIVSDKHRAAAFGVWSIGPTNGPVYGPIIGGFVFEYLGWRWTNWVVLIMGGAIFVLMCFIRETYAPVILRHRAAKLRKETGNPKWWTRYDGGENLLKRLRVGLSRPLVMLVTEPIW